MNRSNSSGSNTVPVNGPEFEGLKETPSQGGGETPKSSRAKPARAKSAIASEAVSSMKATEDEAASNKEALRSHAHHGHGDHSHIHDDESIRRIVNRLSRIEGHVRGLKRMVQDQENCPDVLIQVAAVRGALDKVARLILDEHLTQCVLRAAEQGNIEAEIEELQAALNRFLP